MSIESIMPSNHLIHCRPLLLLPSIFPSIRLFSNESVLLIRWPKNWSFSMSPSNKNSELISFRMDWLDVLASPRDSRVFSNTTIQKHQILQHSSFFMVQLSQPYLTAGKIIALTRWTFVCKVIFLLFNMLSRFATAFHLRSKCLLISWM